MSKSNFIITNFAGSIGKSTFRKQLFQYYLPEHTTVNIESINASASGADSTIIASEFRSLADTLARPDSKVIVDIGGSNVEESFRKIREIFGMVEDVTAWVLPVTESAKVKADTIMTIESLINELDVNPDHIVVIANQVSMNHARNVNGYKAAFGSVMDACQSVGAHFIKSYIEESELFDEMKDDEQTIAGFASMSQGEVNERYPNDPEKLGALITKWRMARYVARNLGMVWSDMPEFIKSASPILKAAA